MLIIDFETRSKVDLQTHGVYRYAEDPSTEILCMAWRDGISNKSGVWYPGDPVPDKVSRAIKDPNVKIAAWNAAFDRLIYDNCDHPFKPIPLNRWVCLSATARYNALPAGLDDCYRALFGKRGKDVRGKQLIDTLCKPDADGNFYSDAALLEALGEYCLQDVAASYECSAAMPAMPADHLLEYHVNERINDNGVCVDVKLCEAATSYADKERQELSLQLSKLTGGRITAPTQTQRIRDYVYTHSNQTVQNMMTVYKKGEAKRSLDKRIRENILNAADEHAIELPDTVYDVILCAHEGSNTSVSKFKRMVEIADPDTCRARGAFVYWGAQQTGRYSSRGVQLHNFRRDAFDETAAGMLKDRMMANRPLTHPMETLSRLLRSAIRPEPGNMLTVADWEQIEARVLPWLSNSQEALPRLDAFARGDDIYQITAEAIGVDDRQVGKVSELAFGFGGGVGAFNAMGRNLGVALPIRQVEDIVVRWRAANPWAVTFWKWLHTAAVSAIKNPHKRYYAGNVFFYFNSELVGGTLICTLPGGSRICYPMARLESDPMGRTVVTAMKANWKPAWDEKEWPRVTLWHGLLAENVTQATAAALLRWALTDIHMEGWDIVAHVHDEIVLEHDIKEAAEVKQAVERIMTEGPDWADGLPLAVDVKSMMIYGK